ncbi:BTB/POZ protein [Rhizophagus irregularis DAOM 181602=DAOM 197198]|nr:BTB/POZ protein [Rhizophagus irregularis DAOM 181602=DAOM 197198]
MSSKFLAELSNDYEKLFETEIGYDVIIHAGEGQNRKEIHAHSNILCIRSQYFSSAFSNEWAEKRDGKFIFKKPNISPQLFNIILRFIYCGIIELKNLQGPDVLELLIAVDELNINSLVSHIQEFLIEHKTEFLQQNPTGILETVYQHETFTDLWNFCLEKICEEPKILFSSDKFINLKAPLLELLLKRDDLNMDEIEIWENLLKWCFAQQNMKNDPTKWSKEDIIRVERELYRFIPLIRFYDIEPTDFFYKVYCCKDVLPQDLIHNLLEFYIVVPNMKFKTNLPPSRNRYHLDSTLIESKHVPIFASWIERKDSSHYNMKNIPYDFKLLYRSNRDGTDTKTFHKNCDNKGATIWVAKIKNSTQIIGGYNPLDWNGNGWKTTGDSFIFNFTDGKNISTSKVSYVNYREYAVFCHDTYGPTMGNLHCHQNKWSNSDGNYPNIGIPENFIVENYEVFQIIKK